jgi:hypothetical protein
MTERTVSDEGQRDGSDQSLQLVLTLRLAQEILTATLLCVLSKRRMMPLRGVVDKT